METVLREIGTDCRTLRLIAPAYAGRDGELTAVLQYVFQSIVFGQLGSEETAREIMEIAKDEMCHLEILGTVITRLGAPPVFTACPPYPVAYHSAACVNYSRTPRQMLSADICAEENAITFYEQVLCRISNPPVAAVITRILGEEREHLGRLNALLGRL